MKTPKKIRRIKIDRTQSKPQGINLNNIIKTTLQKLKEGKFSKSVLTKKTPQKNVFIIKFNTTQAFTSQALRKMRDQLKAQGLVVLDSQTQISLNSKGTGEKSSVLFKVRVRPKKNDTGKRSTKTMKKVLAFIGEI